jgi:hypothetical protein
VNPEEVLELRPEESLVEMTRSSALPRSPFDAVQPVTFLCPGIWAQLAPRNAGLVAGRDVDAWCFAGVLFARATGGPLAFGRLGFLTIPIAYEDVEEFARWPSPEAAPDRGARALSALLGLEPILTERELVATLTPGPDLEVTARKSVGERWRAPFIHDDELCFWAGERRGPGGEVVLVRANLATRWLDVEGHGPVWRVRPEERAGPSIAAVNYIPDPFDDETEVLPTTTGEPSAEPTHAVDPQDDTRREDESAPELFNDETEQLPPRDQLLTPPHTQAEGDDETVDDAQPEP